MIDSEHQKRRQGRMRTARERRGQPGMMNMISAYNKTLKGESKRIAILLARELTEQLKGSEAKVWHGHPVWFLAGNPIAGYALRKKGMTLLFWSGQSFATPGLTPEGSFKAAEVVYARLFDVKVTLLKKWLREAKKTQWNYKDIVKNKGKLSLLPTKQK